MLAKCIVKQADGGASSSWTRTWNISWTAAEGDASSSRFGQGSSFFQSLDVIVEPESTSGGVTADSSFVLRGRSQLDILIEFEAGESGSRKQTKVEPSSLGSSASFEFFLEALEVSSPTADTERKPTAFKLVAPKGTGNIVHSNILPKRLQDLEYISKTVSFAEPLQIFTDIGEHFELPDLFAHFKSALGAVLLRETSAGPNSKEALAVLEKELHNRLCMPLVLPGLKRRTILYVEGGDSLPYGGACSDQLFESARSIGVDIVLLADPNHELRQPKYAHWYKDFIPVEHGWDDELPARIVAAVKQYKGHIDAVLSVFESLHVLISKAVDELGFPHEPTSAYEIATNKGRLSAFEGRNSYIAGSAEEASEIARTKDVPWPIIIKPCRGWGSELVFKLDNTEQLDLAAPQMVTERHGTQFVMEHYCDGPEVDINFVMYEGEVLFWEVADENPKTADVGSNSFHEVDIYFPSQLPKSEQRTLHYSIFSTLKRLGFRNGIFHCEARVDNSSMEWKHKPNGLPELVPHPGRPSKPTSWLIEINTRPPGFHQCDIIETTWGVNYWVSALITKLPGEADRVRTLSTPYRDGAQFHSDMVFISATYDKESKKGIWQAGDVTAELARRRPDLARHISKALTLAKNGEEIPHPSTGVNKLVAYLHLFSRESRERLLEISQEVREDLRMEFE